MRPTRVPVLLAACTALALAGCGSGGGARAQVRHTLDEFGRASAMKDYQAMCDHLLARSLRRQVASVGLPCEVALRMGLEDVKKPTLSVGRIVVHGDTAEAKVRSTAQGQRASSDTITLHHEGGAWRIASLAEPGPPAPSTPASGG